MRLPKGCQEFIPPEGTPIWMVSLSGRFFCHSPRSAAIGTHPRRDPTEGEHFSLERVLLSLDRSAAVGAHSLEGVPLAIETILSGKVLLSLDRSAAVGAHPSERSHAEGRDRAEVSLANFDSADDALWIDLRCW